MKVTSIIKIDGQPVQEVKKAIRLDFDTPGRGIVNVICDFQPVEGQAAEVIMQIGDNAPRVVFTGFVESVAPQQAGHYQLLVRELAALLNRRIAVSLRSCTPQQILRVISDKTGAHFVLPDSDWVKKDTARFQHIGGGYGALDYLLRIFQVQNPVWHQQTDGRIYVGELEKSGVGEKEISIEAAMFSDSSVNAGTLPAVPMLRPGVKVIVDGKPRYISAVDITDNTMRLHWVVNLYDYKLRGIQ